MLIIMLLFSAWLHILDNKNNLCYFYFSDLEANVEELRSDVISKQCRVNTDDIEGISRLLNNVTKALTDLKGWQLHLWLVYCFWFINTKIRNMMVNQKCSIFVSSVKGRHSCIGFWSLANWNVLFVFLNHSFSTPAVSRM